MGIVGILVFAAVLSGLNYYLARRLCQGLSLILPWLRTGLVFALLSGLAVLTVLGFLRSMLPLAPLWKKILRFFFGWWLGIFLYLLMYTVLGDLVSLPLSLLLHGRKWALLRSILVLLLSAATVVYGGIQAQRIHTVSYEVPVENCSPELSQMNIVLISDLHLGALGSEGRLEEIVTRINALQPDLICIAGDFFDSDFSSIADPLQAAETLKQLQSTHGVFACLGNHDAGATYPQMAAFLSGCGIRVLNDESLRIGDHLILAGRPDGSPIGGFGGLTRQAQASFPESPELPLIVLDHNPANAESYGPGADLILCGHTHKGQIFPGSLITRRLFAVDYGYHRFPSGVQAVVTSGVGYWGIPLRIGSRCEIVQIRLVP